MLSIYLHCSYETSVVFAFDKLSFLIDIYTVFLLFSTFVKTRYKRTVFRIEFEH